MHLRIGLRAHHDARQVILRLHVVEFCFVLAVVISDVAVGDIHLGIHFFVQHLFHGEVAADFALQVVCCELLFGQPLFELFLGIGGLELVELAIHFFVGSDEAQFLRSLQHDLLLDQIFQNAETQAGGLLAQRRLRIARGLVAVILFQLGAHDLAAVDAGYHIRSGLAFRAADQACHPQTEKNSA